MSRGMMTWPTHVYKRKVRNAVKHRRARKNKLRRRLERSGKRVIERGEHS